MNDKVQYLRDLIPESGAYVNEVRESLLREGTVC